MQSVFSTEILAQIWQYGVIFILVLSGVIFVHELGHYLMARYFGVRAVTFSVGFGRELFGVTDRRGTRWKLCLFPFGGYVSIFCEEEPHHQILTDDENAVAYYTKPLWQRSLITAAGPLINFLFSFLLYVLVFSMLGKPVSQPIVSGLEIGKAAERAGLQIGDRLIRVNGTRVLDYEQLRRVFEPLANQKTQLELERNGQTLHLEATPDSLSEKDSFGFDMARGYIGAMWPSNGLDVRSINKVDAVDTYKNPDLARAELVKRLGHEIVIDFGKENERHLIIRIRPPPSLNEGLLNASGPDYNTLVLSDRPIKTLIKLPIADAAWEAIRLIGKAIHQTLGTLYQMVVGSKSTNELGGFAKISKMTGESAQRGLLPLVLFIAGLSVNIGFLNLLPVPMLDGGHLAFHLAEAIRKKPPSPKVKGYIYGVGIVFLFWVVFMANLNDLLSLLRK